MRIMPRHSQLNVAATSFEQRTKQNASFLSREYASCSQESKFSFVPITTATSKRLGADCVGRHDVSLSFITRVLIFRRCFSSIFALHFGALPLEDFRIIAYESIADFA